MNTSASPVPGLFTLVLHTHLPWLAHHGRWPVGEEWLYQSWAAAYLPLLQVLAALADENRHRLITLGMTPVVNAQLDDPYCLNGVHHWLANWQLRAEEAASVRYARQSKSADYPSCTPEALRAADRAEQLTRQDVDQVLPDGDRRAVRLIRQPICRFGGVDHPVSPHPLTCLGAPRLVRPCRSPGDSAAGAWGVPGANTYYQQLVLCVRG